MQYVVKGRRAGNTVEMLRQANKRIQQLETALSERWINASKQKPKESGQYLVVRTICGHPVEQDAMFSVEGIKHKVPPNSFWLWESGCGPYYAANVTHWMEMPMLPKEYSDHDD